MNQKRRLRRTTLLSVLCTSFLIGLGLSRNVGSLNYLWVIMSLSFFLALLKPKNIETALALILLGTTAGIVRGHNFQAKTLPYQQLYGQQIVVNVEAATDGVYTDRGMLDFDVSEIDISSPINKTLPGKIRIQGRGVNTVYRGDKLKVSGKLFPAGGSRQGQISFGELEIVARSGEWSEKARREFVAGMQTAIPEPQASFGLGLLVGQRNTLPDNVSEMLAITGLTHIIAVSGYNLTIIVRGVRRVLGKRSKYQSTVTALLLIAGFLLLTGFSASIVRAAIVSLLSIASWYYGRTVKPILIISFTAAVTAGWNPIYLWSDIGWYLSFLAFFGVLVLAPLIKQRLFGKKEPKFLGQIVLESISAQVMAAPLILYIFSEVSIISLASNAIIVPLVPFAMLFSLVGGLAGMLVPVISGLIAWPATTLMTYMLDMVAIFAKVPNALIDYVLPLGGMLFIYASILAMVIILYRKIKSKYGTITDRNIIE